ncbi:MAG TPA: ATP-binding protein [Spirochaetota bacterium]|nr:ATP-binding protein [Spirochaetota bacterium]HPC43172.1 ATP-binding protein [Spirochaetota bacterium]HPL17898.1 ATP-binding protein [Spirochaetota bacterium]HQF10473.1 ATP-binding protein [Spirochaetota bacterium]HQH99494.1 ATP-binding protein [Spirochaetota bacterium]
MWLLNIASINNLLLSILVLIMIVYFFTRAEKNWELFSLQLFIVMIFLWQVSLLLNNSVFHPAAAYPLYYVLNSGFTVLGYLGLTIFSYYFIEPVFEREMRVVVFAGLAAFFIILFYALFVTLPMPVRLRFNPAQDVYVISPSPLRNYIILAQVFLSVLAFKNLIYKTVILEGEKRRFAAKITAALMLGLISVPVTYYVITLFRYDQNLVNTFLTFFASVIVIYFFWAYIDHARIRFFYSDKTRLVILFIVIIIIGVISSFTFMVYRRAYCENLDNIARRIEIDMNMYTRDPEYYSRRYRGLIEFITVKDLATDRELYLIGSQPQFVMAASDPAEGEVRSDFRLMGKKVYHFFSMRRGGYLLQVGFPYLHYRKYLHELLSAVFYGTLATVVALFFLLRFMVRISLIKPLQRLLDGIEELQKGNLDYRIDETSLDEIGFIAQQFNYMVTDLKDRNLEIQRSEKKYRELTALLPDIIYETDGDMFITYLNEAGFALTGYSQGDLAVGLPMSALMEPDDYETLRSTVAKRGDGTSISIITHRVKRRDGSHISAENNVAVTVSGGSIVAMRGIMRDVTEKLRLEQRLIQAQKMEIIGSLAGGIAHDFNNILGGIIGSVSLVEFKIKNGAVKTPAELEDEISTIKISAERGMKMVEQILGISRKQRLTLGVTDLGKIAGHVHEICKNTFDKKIELDFRYDRRNAIMVMGDATQLEQVVLNLCINAHDAMTIMRPAGEEHRGMLSVSIHRVPSGREFLAKYPDASEREYICLRVSDTGVGMDSYTRERVFDPFFTTKEKHRGTGLGLAMVYNIIKQHNGFIDVYSEAGSGTTFNIYIPSAKEDALGREEVLAEPEHRMGEGRVLMIEDDVTIQKTARKILRLLGYDVLIAENGLRGIEVFRERRNEIDAVILDMVMPKRSGKETFVELKKMDPGVRVLVSSGFRNDSRIDEVLAMGARGFLQKPYTIEQLSMELSKVIKGG